MKTKPNLPTLPLKEWESSKITLHLLLQIIGKIRLKLAPRKNHWWYITEYVTTKGFTTSPIPYNNGMDTFEIVVNVLENAVEIHSSRENSILIPLKDGVAISQLYDRLMSALAELGVEPQIVDRPFDMGLEKRFSEITEYHHFDMEYIRRFWRIMLWVDGVMKEFSGRFYGKSCPVHLYWHHMDLTVTRFSGKKAPPLDPGARISDKDAYSHEVISFGFWAGDEQVTEPAFYSYTYPSPEGIENEPLHPGSAAWVTNNGSPSAFYRYEELLNESDPRQALLDFFESAYRAGARLAGWDMEELRTPPLEEL